MPIDKLASATGITKEQMLEVLAMALGYRIKSQYGDVWMSGAAQAVCNVLATLSGLPVYEFMQAVFDVEVMIYRQDHMNKED